MKLTPILNQKAAIRLERCGFIITMVAYTVLSDL